MDNGPSWPGARPCLMKKLLVHIADDARLNENPYIKEFAKPANESQMYLQQLTNFADIENQAITPAFEKILLQNADVKESLDEANDIIQSMLE